MIVANDGHCQIVVQKPEELLRDTRDVITTFIKYCQETQMPEKMIEETLVQMIADGFERDGKVVAFKVENDEEDE